MNAPKRKLTGAALIGRRMGIAVFWCLATFVTVASIRSVVLDLYAKPEQAGNNTRCAEELRTLHASLLDKASDELRARPSGDGNDLEHTTKWLESWDKRFVATREDCAGLSVPWKQLQMLREKLGALLRDYVREQRPLTERIERALSLHLTADGRSILPRES
jgi:hypothetical protein